MSENQDFTKFKFAEKFERLPSAMRAVVPSHYGVLDFAGTRVDMVPAGLKGVDYIHFNQMPRYISPDFEGEILIPNGVGPACLSKKDIEVAKTRYKANQEMVEKPRYVEEEDGSLSLCSLPKNIRFILHHGEDCDLDLTETDIIEKQNLEGFKNIILYPKREQLTKAIPQKVARHRKPQMVHSKPRIKE